MSNDNYTCVKDIGMMLEDCERKFGGFMEICPTLLARKPGSNRFGYPCIMQIYENQDKNTYGNVCALDETNR